MAHFFKKNYTVFMHGTGRCTVKEVPHSVFQSHCPSPLCPQVLAKLFCVILEFGCREILFRRRMILNENDSSFFIRHLNGPKLGAFSNL